MNRVVTAVCCNGGKKSVDLIQQSVVQSESSINAKGQHRLEVTVYVCPKLDSDDLLRHPLIAGNNNIAIYEFT